MEQLSQIETFLSLHQQRSEVKHAIPGIHRSRLDHQPRGLGKLHPAVQQTLNDFLFQPALEIRQRPSHSFRSHLVDVGFLLAGSAIGSRDRRNLDLCAESIEFLHLGSLIVDDIQDGSEVRRSGKALHCLLGTPHALGIGNWLYFYAMRILSNLDLSETQRNVLYEVYVETVELAHYGQIMDLCIKVDRVPYSQIDTLSQECIRYKTGSIVMLALMLGALAGGADDEKIQAVEELGYALGVYLQRMNDLGNCLGSFDPEKKWEDLVNWKPTFIWGFVAREYGGAAVQQLIQAVRELPNEAAWQAWLDKRDLFDEAKAMAEQDFEQSLQTFRDTTQMSWNDLRPLAQLKERIQKAYG
ncbi:MAG TPA: polyprenyl synthetase family protein [Oligoflexus sp.]|uniref:polyprenyl synthetase family protein n=1 Tax=Oligoflexus sp. TaxID=1971216 RepID=UPI002D3A6C4D|nr:polyprenyl synthetase family protein [Oligoflexus sp.]HYX39722.1 polyprenyl synthetase family protein [Oligoflexus sp.]